MNNSKGYIDILLGLIFGDEGKGKIVNALAPNYDITARFNGSSNAGHTLEYNGFLMVLHTIPSGICRKNNLSIIGNGVAISPYDLISEINDLRNAGVRVNENNLRISDKAIITMPHHQIIDSLEDLIRNLGTTGKGVGPVFSSKIARDAIRTKDLLDKDKLNKFYKNHEGILNNQINYLLTTALTLEMTTKRTKYIENNLSKNNFFNMGKIVNIKEILDYYDKTGSKYKENLDDNILSFLTKNPFDILDRGLNIDNIIDSYHAAGLEFKGYLENTPLLLKSALENGKHILAEGAQAARLDIEHGTYPYVTSSNCGTAGAISGLGIPHTAIRDVIGVVKLVESRVGEGPFDTEIIPYSNLVQKYNVGEVKKIFTKGMSEEEKIIANKHMEYLRNKINHYNASDLDKYMYFANLPPGEFGATTGRPRAVGWLNLPRIAYDAYLNGVNKLALTKIDSYVNINHFPVCIEYNENIPTYTSMNGFSEVNAAREYSQLPPDAIKLVELVEDVTKVKAKIISVGPLDAETIMR